jgi:hypothetical protein
MLILSLFLLTAPSVSAQTCQGRVHHRLVACQEPVANAAPQAAGWALMLTGCAMVGAVLRHRRASDAALARS